MIVIIEKETLLYFSLLQLSARRLSAFRAIRDALRAEGGGTGSYPLPPKGLQRRIRQIASPQPLITPCFSKASSA